ncbi:hypothetical protein INT47_000228 [Mucor saturninus]|uniref:RhoGAP-domain-containing protein n=1 Tax=Mucor saturninus TaxID=64648 RepID=A0A8H7R4U7_9FUNG|nr:hypothetical protein INT47_000228 [Mucor saturninus]
MNLQDFKEQNDRYWKIIEKQRKIIQNLQKTVTQLTAENDHLQKKNKEYLTQFDSVAHHPLSVVEANLPVPPPRSPYRVHKEQKRPPVLQLKTSNHRVVSIPSPTISRRSSLSPNGKSRTSHLDKQRTLKSSKSEPSTPIKPRTPRFESLMMSNQQTKITTPVLSNFSNIQFNVVNSSIHIDEKGKEVPLFTIGIIQLKENYEIWRIEKNLNDFLNLDAHLKEGTMAHLKRLPDKVMTHVPAKVDERKAMIEEYLQHAITLRTVDLRIISAFLSTDQICQLPIQADNVVKHGHLTKRGKNFGGWMSRYFILDHTGLLKYYESKDGQFLGTISLIDSQIGCQPQGHDNFRHAFLILEPRTNGTNYKHIFCASSDDERDSWVEALRYYTQKLHITEDVMNSFFCEDVGMTGVLEPSSSTESASMVRKRPSMDNIFHYFGRRASKDLTSPKDDFQEDTEEVRKPKQRASKKTFWKKKMFSNSTFDAHPIDYKHMLDDYEETKGDSQVFGIPLQNAVMVARVYDQYQLPAIVHRCIEYMEMKDALVEEGIYRLSGSAALMKSLKKRFNDDGDVKILQDKEYHDVHAVAGLLKMWLRELPENILTESLLIEFSQSFDFSDRQTKVSKVGKLVSLLPLVNYTLLRSLCAHLIRVIENSDQNKMTLKNISIVFSATLDIPSSIFNLLLVEFDYIFLTDRCSYQTPPNTASRLQYYSLKREEDRLRRNSTHYQDNTPKDFISLEKQLNAVIDDISNHDEEAYYSDGELEVAYFATRYAVSKPEEAGLCF